jgi:RHS repeat-associated protein
VGNTYQFDAFGMSIASAGTIANTYLYSGERFDSNINLYHLRARYYNMLTGRFETMDPDKETCCALRTSQVGNIFDPSSLHKYVYAQNNPVNRIDPKGTDSFEEGSFLNFRNWVQFRPVIWRYLSQSEIIALCTARVEIQSLLHPDWSFDDLAFVYALCLASANAKFN